MTARPYVGSGTARGRKPWPTGLIGMLVLVTAVERCVARHELMYASVAEAAWKWSGEHVASASGRPVIGFGDSLIKNSVLPSVIEARAGVKAWNFAVPSGVAPLHYFLLRRLIRAGERPEAVLLDGESVDVDPMFDHRVWERTLRVDESVNLAWTTRDAGFLTDVALSRAPPHVFGPARCPREHHVGPRGEGTGRTLRGLPSLAELEPKRRRVRSPGPTRPARRRPARPTWSALPTAPPPRSRTRSTTSTSRGSSAWPPRTACAVYWVLPPLHPEVQARRERFGRDAWAVDYARQLLADHSGLKVIDGRHAAYPPEALFDHSHLSRTGAVVFTDAVGRIIRDRDGPRWIELPRYDPSAATPLAAASSAEDLHYSNIRVFTHPGTRPVRPSDVQIGSRRKTG